MVLAWMGLAIWLRWRRVGSAAPGEFFFRHAVTFCLALPVTLGVYYLWFQSFPPPSSLNDSQLEHMAVGAILLTVVGTAVVVAVERWWLQRRWPTPAV
jgi:hypothetical protein